VQTLGGPCGQTIRRLQAPTAGAALAAIALGLAPAPASAEQSAPVKLTGEGEHQFVVPAGVTSVEVQLVGARGGGARLEFGGVPPVGGRGAQVEGTLSVTPGETLFVEIGGEGATNLSEVLGAGGFNGGGNGAFGTFPAHAAGGGGGGATDVRSCSIAPSTPGQPAACASVPTLASRLLVAGGGGGAGGQSSIHGSGGAGGAAGAPGTAGAAYGGAVFGGGGGENGGSAAGGKGGLYSAVIEGLTESEEFPGLAGTLGSGGRGGGYKDGGGGGGGGGIFGGGGGGGGNYELPASTEHYGAGGGGGGGSSGRPAGVPGVTVTEVSTAAPEAAASATFSWTLPPPAAVTGLPQSVTSSSAVLAGTVNPDGSSVGECRFSIAPAPSGSGTVPCSQQVGAGATAVAVSAAVGGLSPATTYTVTLVAASAQGSSTGSPVAFTTPAGPQTAAAPVVGALKLSPTRFRRGRSPAAIARRPGLPSATTISFTLSLPATVTLQFERAGTGVLSGHRCVAASGRHARGRRCTRYVPLSRGVRRSANAGPSRIRFSGVLDGGSRLAPGTYRLSLGATGAGGSTAAPRHPVFTVLGP
jgi:hypothetical protein